MIRVGLYAVYRAYAHASRFVVVAHAFGAFCGVYLVDFGAHINGFIWALWIAHITVNALAVYK